MPKVLKMFIISAVTFLLMYIVYKTAFTEFIPCVWSPEGMTCRGFYKLLLLTPLGIVLLLNVMGIVSIVMWNQEDKV